MEHRRAPEYDEPTGRDAAQTQEEHTTLNPTQARQSVRTGRMRYVLAISIALVVVAFAALLILYAVG